MAAVAGVVGWLACAGAFAGACYAIACMFAAARFCKEVAVTTADAVAVTVLKPLYRAEPHLAENLESFCRQHYAAPVQLVFGMAVTDDAARVIAKQVKANHPEADIAIVAGTTRHGLNPKISNLLNMLPAAKHDLLVISDSDIAVAPNYLAIIAAAIQTPGTGAVTCCYTGAAAIAGLWPRLSAMGINQRFLPDVLFAIRYGLASPCFGSTIALTRNVLAEIGGLSSVAGLLADDYEIGRAVRNKGYEVAVPPMTVTHWCSEQNFAQLLRHEVRWARTIRAVNPIGFSASIVTHSVPLGLLACVLTGFAPVPVMGLTAAMVARTALAARINALFGTHDPIWLVPLRDLLSFLVFIGALFATKVDWRGARFRVSSAGALAQD